MGRENHLFVGAAADFGFAGSYDNTSMRTLLFSRRAGPAFFAGVDLRY
jgi:hypothetical protein